MLIDPYTWHTASIVRVVREAPRAVSIQVTVDEPYHFECGQYAVVRVHVPSGISLIRQYSFASAPDSGEIWFTIVEEPHGEVSGWFNTSCEVGSTIEISEAFTGSMHNLARANKRICLLAGGSGIVPLMSHIRAWRINNQAQTVTLLYSTRTNEMCYQNELTPKTKESISLRLTDASPRFTREEISPRLKEADIAMICGSRHFVTAMREICETHISQQNIISEAFSL